MESLYNLTDQELLNLYKKNKIEIDQLDSIQNSYKILTNGLYGALSNQYFRWFDINLAESVTITGQLYIRWVMSHINEYLNRICHEDKDWCIAGDTDSVFVDLEYIVNKMKLEDNDQIVDFLDNVCKQKLELIIIQACKELGSLLNCYRNVVVAKREIIADKAIWRKMKNYILNVWDKESVRYKNPVLVMKGVEAVRSSTPVVCRNKIKEALRIILQEDEIKLQNFLSIFKEEFMKLTFEEIASPRTIDGVENYYDPIMICKKATPIHVRGALVYNDFLKRFKITNDFRFIKDRDKVRFVYLKEPNPFKSHVITIPDEGNLPKQFNEVLDYIDKDTQWDKVFISPIKSITDLINWDLEKRTKIDAFFV